jgi:hypothetical protein
VVQRAACEALSSGAFFGGALALSDFAAGWARPSKTVIKGTEAGAKD